MLNNEYKNNNGGRFRNVLRHQRKKNKKLKIIMYCFLKQKFQQ